MWWWHLTFRRCCVRNDPFLPYWRSKAQRKRRALDQGSRSLVCSAGFTIYWLSSLSQVAGRHCLCTCCTGWRGVMSFTRCENQRRPPHLYGAVPLAMGILPPENCLSTWVVGPPLPTPLKLEPALSYSHLILSHCVFLQGTQDLRVCYLHSLGDVEPFT